MSEFAIQSYYCFPKCTLDSARCKIGNFELPSENLMETWFHVRWKWYFWGLFTCILFNAGVFVVHGVLGGKKQNLLVKNRWIWEAIWVINGTLYVIIITVKFREGCIVRLLGGCIVQSLLRPCNFPRQCSKHFSARLLKLMTMEKSRKSSP